MLNNLTKSFIIVCLFLVLFIAPAPKAQAMEPVMTSMIIALVAPYAIKLAKAATPYFIKGGTNFAGGMVDVFVDMAQIFLLPLGFFESTFLGPFGFFTMGLRHMGRGGLAPLKMTWSTAILPVRIFTG